MKREVASLAATWITGTRASAPVAGTAGMKSPAARVASAAAWINVLGGMSPIPLR
jgi:hypothetical protein